MSDAQRPIAGASRTPGPSASASRAPGPPASATRAPAPIALLTDFGLEDWYVAEMKGVLLSLAPGAPLVDITHGVPPGDVEQAAYLLARARGTFPDGTVFLAVVDPGVGTQRKPLAVHSGERFYVGPDNGVLEAALDAPAARARAIEDATLLSRASHTFHGRDIFAPVAARLACQGHHAWTDLGRILAEPVRLARAIGVDQPAPTVYDEDHLSGRVAYVDRFGNAITDVTEMAVEAWLGDKDPGGLVFTVHGVRTARVQGLAQTYGDADGGAGPIALVGSSGHVEIAIPGAHAALRLGVVPGDRLEVRYEEPPS